MTDFMTPLQRSHAMSKVRSKDTKNEQAVRSYLHNHGFRFRKNVKYLPGKPDIVLPKYKSVIFIHGCFWHNHNCSRGALPSSRRDFWENKILNNKNRDEKNIDVLLKADLRVKIIWGCELKRQLIDQTMTDLVKWLKNHDSDRVEGTDE